MSNKSSLLNILTIFSLLLFSASCQYPQPVRQALMQSGENKAELEKVLKHYGHGRQQALHLKAAEFLIAEMPGHYSYESKTMSNYIATMDSMYPDMSNVIKRVVYQIPMRDNTFSGTKVFDIEFISSDFLITHIDNVVEMWQSCPWLKDITFAEFCEYLLPYRFAQEPLLTEMDSTAYWWKEMKSQMDYFKNLPLGMPDVRHFLHNMIDRTDDQYMQDIKTPLPSKLKYTFDCLDKCYYNITTLRSAGVPAAIDFVPDWPTRNGRHYWWVFIDPLCMNNTNSDTHYPRAAKVLRQMYSHHKIPGKNKASKEYIPEQFLNPFNADVTRQYVKVSNIRVSLGFKKQKYVYLAVFNGLAWRPVAWAKIKAGKACFKDMGRGVVYLPVCFESEEIRAVTYPLLLHPSGELQTLKPGDSKINLSLTRKYPLTYSKTQWSRDMINCRFEASNDSTFCDSVVVFRIERPDPNLNFVNIPLSDTLKAYRYWRIIGKRIYLGELAFFDAQNSELKGRSIFHAEDKGETHDRAFDNNVLTYSTTYSWLGMDFGEPQKINSIRYVSRTDANGIIPGMTYELFYFDRDWVSAGKQVATSDSLYYENVPAGALYWLRNLNEGREERIFTYDKDFDRIEFW